MANEMTAAEIIALLWERPGCCNSIEIAAGMNTAQSFGDSVGMVLCDDDENVDLFRRWLRGAVEEWFDGEGRPTRPHRLDSSNRYVSYDMGKLVMDAEYPTFLHAATAAIEAHAKQ